jgi:virulence-associated protein VagC
MVTKEEIKREVDSLPDNLLNEVYLLLKKVSSKSEKVTAEANRLKWEKWRENLKNFSDDFMIERNQPTEQQVRESFD